MELSAARCRLLVGALPQLARFADGATRVSARTPHGTLRSIRVGKLWVLALTERGQGRPTHMTMEETRALLAYEREMRRFALSR